VPDFLPTPVRLLGAKEESRPNQLYEIAIQHDALAFLLHLLQPGAHIWLVLLVEMHEEQAAAELLFF
jgi:Na+-translocating ferredoxin:NAD+ oxidoreductase RnfE subunit